VNKEVCLIFLKAQTN